MITNPLHSISAKSIADTANAQKGEIDKKRDLTNLQEQIHQAALNGQYYINYDCFPIPEHILAYLNAGDYTIKMYDNSVIGKHLRISWS